jgi:hypothetical protein
MSRYLLLLTLSLLLALPVQAQDSAGDLLGRINNLRASLGLPGYRVNGALTAAAQSHAQWMADTGSISHVRPDGSGPRTRAVNAGYPTTDVSENIYGGSNATVDTAWAFWVNSGIHYRGLTEPRFQEIGIGIARGAIGTTYVLVFGNPGGPAPFVPPRAASGGGGSAAPAGPPSFVRGQDEQGFILHEIQPEDTLGDIALLYGYTWDDIPYMMAVNGLENNRSLQIGALFRVPPHDGTYTPTPDDQAANTTPAPESTAAPSATPEPSPTQTPAPTLMVIATAAAMPEVLAVAIQPSAIPPSTTPVPVTAASTITRSSETSPWLILALVVQVGLLLVAGVEFIRRIRHR